MPRTVLRQFTGGISNEIDAQNLRDDQGEEAIDINLKGFALEPGEGLDPLSDAGHYYYRGEWIKDSEAVSFEESGVGVVKTYDAKRPQFEEIINNKDNVARNLGPALPPGAVITGTIVSEGTRGERPGDGAHLLGLPSDKLGALDTFSVNQLTIGAAGTGYKAGDLSASAGGFTGTYTVTSAGAIDSVKITNGGVGYINAPTVIISDSGGSNGSITAGTEDAPSLKAHKTTSTQDSDHVYYYSNQPYWVEKSGNTWNVKTRAYVNGAFTGNDITSDPLTHHSGGSFFKENYFICWDEQFIETVPLLNSVLTANSFDTIDTTQNGDVGSNFGFDSTATYPATAIEITSADICNGVVTFTQKIETANRAGAKVLTEYDGSTDERWILPRKRDSYILLLRDGQSYNDWVPDFAKTTNAGSSFFGHSGWSSTALPSNILESTGAYNAGDDDVKIFTVANPDGAASWITPQDKINTSGGWPNRSGIGYDYDWAAYPRDIGLKYIVKHFPANTWACVKQTGANKPEIMVIEGRDDTITAQNAKDVTVTRSFSETLLKRFKGRTRDSNRSPKNKYWIGEIMRFHMHIYMKFPHIGGSIYWEGDPIPEKPYYWSDFTTFTYNSSDKQQPGSRGTTWGTHTRRWGNWFGQSDGFWWGNRQNPEYQTMSDPLHPTNWHGDTNMRGRHSFKRTVQEYKPEQYPSRLFLEGFANGLKVSQKAILWVGNGLVKNTIVHPSHWDNEGGYRADKAYKNASIRLCSYTPGGAITLQTHAGQSTIHTTAKIASSDKSIEFVEANLTNFTSGDYIRVSGGLMGRNQTIGTKERRIGLNLPLSNKKRTHEYFVARIKEVVVGSPGKLKLEAIPGHEKKFMRNINEDCYPIITTIDNNLQAMPTSLSDIPTQKRRLIRTGLEVNTLLGCNHGRRWGHVGDKELIEVRNSVGAGVTNSDYAHKIDWEGRTVRAVNPDENSVRIVYMKGGFLYSQNGIDRNVNPSSTVFSDKGSFHLINTFLTVVDNGNITVFDPNFNPQFVKGRPEKQSGLGLTGAILDGITIDNPTYGIFVFVKFLYSDGNEYWKMVKTGNKPEITLLAFNFIKPIEYDGAYAWGTFKDESGNYDLHTTVPFYESDVEQSWINFSENNNGNSAWGQILKSRLSVADKDGNIKRWLAVDWKYDSGLGSGDPTIGLAHEANKMVGVNNEFTWYPSPFDAPATLVTSGAGTEIADPKVAIKFKSKITRDVVFFQTTETVLPVSGATGAENQVSFASYEVAAQKFYVLNDNIISLSGEDPEEQGYQLGQANTTADAFDASRAGRSAYLVGAPNMYNPYGPNIDFYYRASFIDKWNHESVPSPLPTAGIEPLDSADDCIQINLSPEFFRFDNDDITKIRLYRYGGDSSEFMFLRDIPIPTIASFPLAIPVSGTGFTGTMSIKAALSSFYLIKTYYNISELANFTNSAFNLTATPTDIDGSWRINQVYEAEDAIRVLTKWTSTLSEDLDETATIVKLTNVNSVDWPATGVIKIEKEYISYSGRSTSTNNLTGCVRAVYGSKASSHSSTVSPPSAVVVEWVLEMEHRNQDTTTLDQAIESTTATPVPTTIYVADTSVFPDASISGSPGPKKLLIGNQIINYIGKTPSVTYPNIHSFIGCTVNDNGGIATNHSVGVLVLSYNETYNAREYTNISLEINELGYRDKARTPIMSLHSMREDNYPPLATRIVEEKIKFYETEAAQDFFRYITAVGSLYFGAVDADLRFSRYGSPEYWPLEATVTLDSEIKGIMEHAGEGIVFTTNSVYRVRGTDPKAMIAFRVPDAKGIMDGDRHSIAEFNGGIIWKTASDGLCMYSGGRVSYITRDKHKIPNMDKPNSCVADGVYWLLQRPKASRETGDTGNGFRLEITSGDMRLCQTSIQSYYAYFAKALGKAVVVTSDDSLSSDDSSFVVQEIGGTKAKNISWRSKKIDAGDPAVAKAFGSIAVVYESLESQISPTATNGIRGEALAVFLLGLSADNLDAGDLDASALDGSRDLYDVFTKYDSVGQEFVADIGGTNWDADHRKTILMPVGFDTSVVNVDDSVWAEDDTKNALLADNTKVKSVGTETVGGTAYPTIVLDNEPLRSGDGNIIWGNLPKVHIYINNESNPSRSFTLPPIVSDEPQSADLYLNDLRKFRTISVKVEGNLRINTISLRHFPIQQFQSQTLHHSADIFYKGVVDFRVMLDGDLIYRKELDNAGTEFTEERIYLPASSFGSRIHYMNESRNGMIESVTFNGSLAA